MPSKIEVKEPELSFYKAFFTEGLLKGKAYSLVPSSCENKLDQNELPFDWDESLKRKVTERLFEEPWNTYPEDYPRKLKALIADSVGVRSENIVLSPGSNYHISVLLSLFGAKESSDIVLTRPSFPLFEAHCKYQNIPYRVWQLNGSLEYDLDLLPELKKGSCVFFCFT